MHTDMEKVKEIVRTNPSDFQETIENVSGRILSGKQRPKPAAIAQRFCDLWRHAQGKDVIAIGWLLADTAIGQGKPTVDRQLAEAIRQPIDPRDDQSDPSTLQDWIWGLIFYTDDGKTRLADAVRGYRPPEKQPLGEVAALLYEKLKSLPEHKAMTIPQILDWLSEKHNIEMDEGTLRRNHLEQLKPYGLVNTRRIGYHLRR